MVAVRRVGRNGANGRDGEHGQHGAFVLGLLWSGVGADGLDVGAALGPQDGQGDWRRSSRSFQVDHLPRLGACSPVRPSFYPRSSSR